MHEAYFHTVKKLFASLIFGLLVTGLAPFAIMDAYAQSVLYGTTTSGMTNPSDFYQIDPATGNAVLIGPIGFNRCSAIAFHPITDVLYGTCADNIDIGEALVTIDVNTGMGTRIGNTGVIDLTDISFSNDGTTLFADRAALLTINIVTGLSSFVGDFNGGGCCGNGLAMSPANQLFHSDDEVLLILNQGTGSEISSVPHGYPFPVDDFPRNNALAFQPDSGILFASLKVGGQQTTGNPSQSFLATVDTTTAIVSVIGQTVDGLDAIAFLEDDEVVGGELLPIETTSLLLASAQSFSWMIPLVLSVLGIGLFVVSRKSE